MSDWNKNIGVVIFGRKRPGFDQAWSKVVRERSLAAIDAIGLTPFGADPLVYDDPTLAAALRAIRTAECDALVILQPSIGDGQFALSVMQQWDGPIVLWATPERPGDGKVSSCSLVGAHLWASILRQAGRDFELVYGDGELASVQSELSRAVLLTASIPRLRRAKVGLIGTHAPGFVDLAADPFLLRTALGLQLHTLSLAQYIDRVKAIPEEEVSRDVAKARALGLPASKGAELAVSDETLAASSRYYLSMLDTMREAGLEALAVQCWPELPSVFCHWPYMAISRLTAESKCVAIEGDVDGAVQSLMSTYLGLGPGFLTDWLEHDASTIFLWHPGMASLEMCNAVGSEDGPTLGTHFNGGQAGVVDGPLRLATEVTITRLWRCDNAYHMTAFEGRAIPSTRKVSGNSLLVEVDGGKVPERFDDLIHAGMPHHVLAVPGKVAESFRRLARLLHVAWH